LKRKRPLLILSMISRGDRLVRDIYHKLASFYSEGKEKLIFFVNKQLPLRTKNIFYKLLNFIKEKFEDTFGNIRNSRLLKKSDGISEFYKNISEIEKGNGEINDTLEDISQKKEDGVN
jgi:hypothetical protein